MQGRIHVRLEDRRIDLLRAPFSQQNSLRWKAVGGQFVRGVWRLPYTPEAQEVLKEMFGDEYDPVFALVPASKLVDGPVVQIGGYVLASRRQRDGMVRLFEGVSLFEGRLPDSAGSSRKPRVGLTPDCVFGLRCRRTFAKVRSLEILYIPPTYELES